MVNSEQIEIYLKKNFSSIGDITKIEILSELTNSTNYKISSNNNKYIFHQVNDGSTIKKIETMCQILEFCSHKNALVQYPIKNDLDFFVSKKNKFFLTKFYDGHTFSGKKKEFLDLATKFAELHQILNSCKISFNYRLNQKFYRLININEFQEILKLICKKKQLTDLDKLFLKNRELLLESFTRFKPLKSNSSLPKQLIHHDLHPKNAIFNNNKIISIIDFSTMRLGTILEDIAFTSYRYSLFQSNEIDSIKKNISLFINKYLETNSLTYITDELLSHFLYQKILGRLSLILKKYYFYNSDLWVHDFLNHILMLKQIKSYKIFDLGF